MLAALARAHVHGAPVNWAAVLGHGKRVDLPTYAFQHQRYWPELVPAALNGRGAMGGDGAGTAAETRFWAAVEGGDLEALSDTLAVRDRTWLGQLAPVLASWRRRERDQSVTESWRYRVSWVPVAEPTPVTLAQTWLFVVPARQAGADLVQGCVRVLTSRGVHPVVIEVAEEATRETLAAQISGMLAADGDTKLAGVLSLLALDTEPRPDYPVVPGGLAGTLALVQALGDIAVAAPLWLLTRGAVAAGVGEVLDSPVQGQVWGLGRVVALEYPDRWGGLIDLPAASDDRALARLGTVLAGCGEDEVAIRSAGIAGRRLVRAPLASDREEWLPAGTVLVTGGTGAIGGHVARWLARAGAPRVVLTSRSGPAAPGAASLAACLAEGGTAVEVIACDAAERNALAALLTRIAVGGPRLTGVMHTAGVLDDGLLDGMSPGRLATVLTAKAVGAAHLDELTRGLDLEQFVLFSSAAATFGGAGQGNYAAANAFLDGLAQQRAARGLAALSVAWGPWAGGMAQANEAVRRRLRRGPLPEMDPDLAIRALGEALGGPDSLLAVMDVDWAQFTSVSQAFVQDLPDVRELAHDAGPGTGDSELARGELARQLTGLPPTEQVRVLTDLIRGGAAAVLGHASVEAIEPDRAFSDLGFDSLTSLEMRQHLNTATGLRLPATLLFDYPTPALLAEFLRDGLLGDLAADKAVPVVTVAQADGGPIAIVGMGCRYPGGVSSPKDLWELLSVGYGCDFGVPGRPGLAH